MAPRVADISAFRSGDTGFGALFVEIVLLVSRSLLSRSPNTQQLVGQFIGATYVFVAALFLPIHVDGWE